MRGILFMIGSMCAFALAIVPMVVLGAMGYLLMNLSTYHTSLFLANATNRAAKHLTAQSLLPV